MDVQVDETGRNNQAARIEFFVGAAHVLLGERDFGNAAIA